MSVRIMSLVFDYDMPDLIFQAGDQQRTVKASTCKFVLLAISDHANDLGKSAYPGLTRLQRKTGLSRQGVINAIEALKANGYITVDNTPSELSTNNYTIIYKMLVNHVDQSTPLTRVVNPVDLNHPLTINNKEGNIFKVYESTVGPMTPNLVDDLKDAEKEYPADWITDAFKIAAEGNKRNWRYVKAVLRNWQTNGRDWKPGKSNGDGQQRVAIEEY